MWEQLIAQKLTGLDPAESLLYTWIRMDPNMSEEYVELAVHLLMEELHSNRLAHCSLIEAADYLREVEADFRESYMYDHKEDITNVIEND